MQQQQPPGVGRNARAAAVAATLLLLLAACTAPTSTSPTPTPAPVTVETSIVPPGSGRIDVVPSPGKDGKYLQGTNLLVTAVSSPGYQFVGWAGGASGTANPVSITVQSALSIVASFAATAAAGAPAGTPALVAAQAPSPTAATPTQTPAIAASFPTATVATPTRTAAVPTQTPAIATSSPAATVATPTRTAVATLSPTPATTEGQLINVEIKNDPLSFKIVETAAGKIAVFDNWAIEPVGQDSKWLVFNTYPKGRDDFGMLVTLGIAGTQGVQNLFVEGPTVTQQLIQGFQRVGGQKMTKYGGDEAMVEEYQGTLQGKAFRALAVYIKKTDVVVGLIAFGTDQGFTDYGRSVDILAQSITVNQSPLPPTLIGRWRYNSGFSTDNQALNTGKITFSHESETQLTIYPNGTFTEASMSFSTLGTYDTTTSGTTDGSDRGRVVIHGTTLSFQYDNGKVWNAEYKFDGGTLVLNGSYYSRVG